jgi:hypothetical protein
VREAVHNEPSQHPLCKLFSGFEREKKNGWRGRIY